MHLARASLIAGLLGGSTYAATVPANVEAFYKGIIAQGSCTNKLATGLTALDGGASTFSYCGDHLDDYNVMYIQGTGGKLADMDIDCDGEQGDSLDDGRCGSSKDTQGETAFKSTIKGYNVGITDLNSFAHPYVVFGNDGTKSGYVAFSPEDYGVKPLSVIAVVCANQLFFGIWGDTNGDDGPKAMVGEASISLATLCFGDSMNGDNGYSELDVLYIAFTGPDAVPGASGAAWDADNVSKFESSLQTLGNKLISRIGGPAATTTAKSTAKATTTKVTTTKAGTTLSTTTEATASATATSVAGVTGVCGWDGHCNGATCSTDYDCYGQLSCQGDKCASVCSWAGHCVGDACSVDDDCNGTLSCQGGQCGAECAWMGRCYGANCVANKDCSGELTCQSGMCAVNCSWLGHCMGAMCSVNGDCNNNLTCQNGECGP